MMESLKYSLLERAIKWLTGTHDYNEIKKVVNTFMNSKLSGEVKRQKVESIVMPIFATTILPVLINVAIEVAVAVLKSQIKTES